ncbi:MAG: PaaI family thioesterase [Dehalococcoidia bacterium]|nr:PaaI family thioesterase [Dehalococcoidia bacterium]
MPDKLKHLLELGKNEPVAGFLEMRLLELSPGHARVSMPMKPEYINFNGMIFGGIISAVADQAFAYATNSVINPNVASQFNIHFIAAVGVQDELTAECRVMKSGKRVCISEIKVTNQEGKLVATATGTTIPLV